MMDRTRKILNVYLKTLKEKIELHTQLIAAYELLHAFERASYDDDGQDEEDTSSPSSIWSSEAQSWIQTHELVTDRGLDRDIIKEPECPLVFSIFAKACLQQQQQLHQQQQSQPHPTTTNGRRKIFLCDSTRDRRHGWGREGIFEVKATAGD